jgi:SAM-dependent methyltransferase
MSRFPIPPNDRALAEFNALLPWFAATALQDGRQIGTTKARESKRNELEPIPDKRIARLAREYPDPGNSVLELGCFEGIHTLGLREFYDDVTAVDVRPVNVLKTLARLAVHGVSAKVHVLDVEDPMGQLPRFDLIFHCGVLYHLADPVTHLRRLLAHCGKAVYLDTHIADATLVDGALDVGDSRFEGHRFKEGGWADPYSGRGDSAFWLKLQDLRAVIESEGFETELWSQRAERNGPRVGLLARRRIHGS